MLKKSTSQAMPVHTLAAQYRKMLETKDGHRAAANYYNQLFNATFGEEIILSYTPYQVFLQSMATYHQCEALKLQTDLIILEAAA